MKINMDMLVKCIVAVVLVAAVLTLAQMWFHLFSTLVFWKIIASLVIIGGVASFIAAVKADITSDQKMKDDKYLD